MTLFFAMAVFAFVTSLSPGPVNMLATIIGANYGYVKTIPHILGATIGFVSILALLGIGLVTVFNDSYLIIQPLSYIGGMFLLYLAYNVITSKPSENTFQSKKLAPTVFQGLLCQWLNPKAWIVSLSGITAFSTNGAISLDTLLLFSLIFFVICYCCISTWALLGLTIGKYLEQPLHYQWFNRIMGSLLALTVLYLFFISA